MKSTDRNRSSAPGRTTLWRWIEPTLVRFSSKWAWIFLMTYPTKCFGFQHVTFDAGKHLDWTTANTAGLNIDIEYTLQALHPSHRCQAAEWVFDQILHRAFWIRCPFYASQALPLHVLTDWEVHGCTSCKRDRLTYGLVAYFPAWRKVQHARILASSSCAFD